MTTLALGLVLLSALAHASWNLLLKRSSNQEAFVWWLLVADSLLLLPLGAVLLWLYPITQPGWWLVLATVVLHIFYFVLLGRGYARADLSLVYPIARGLGPMLVPALAVALLDEQVSPPAVVGIGSIVVGIYLVSWWGRFRQLFRQPLALLRDPGVRYAILTGLTIAAYALVDKRGVGHVQPFLYMYLLTLGCALGLAPYILGSQGRAAVVQVWRSSVWTIVAAGLLTFLAYGLVLTAFSISRVSYVAPAREVGIVVGVLLGIFVLKEPFGAGRLLGSSFILLGLVFIALAP
ncbi:MAG TPA: SMR family transporter [Dehalococcoidia bacterium]|nr:SMR family transporter [Dehalococcoidia bacterium]